MESQQGYFYETGVKPEIVQLDSIPYTHLHWLVWCAHGHNELGYQEVTDVDVIAGSEAEALARAQALCPGRKHYFMRQVVEHHAHNHNEPMTH